MANKLKDKREQYTSSLELSVEIWKYATRDTTGVISPIMDRASVSVSTQTVNSVKYKCMLSKSNLHHITQHHEVRKSFTIEFSKPILLSCTLFFLKAILAVVMVVFSSQAFGYSYQSIQYPMPIQRAGYQPAALAQPNLYSATPEVASDITDLLLKTVRRTDFLVDSLPPMDETAANMADLWAIAYPQLKTLLTKANAWANQIPIPSK